MDKDIKELSKPLDMEDIDFRIQSINKGGYATILAYKDARVDMNRLDEVVGCAYWKREHFDNNTKCRVSIYIKEIKEWVSKEDIGTASNTEAQKGLASDSFKRACFNWGIGRELYDYPLIQVKLNSTEFTLEGGKAKQTWALQLKEWKWHLNIDEKGKILGLFAIDENKDVRFKYGIPKKSGEKAIETVSNYVANDINQ